MTSRLLLLILYVLGLSTPLRAETISLGTGQQPRILSDGDQRLSVVFGRTDEIAFATSEDGGITFNKAQTVAKVPGLLLGMRRGPRAALTTKSIVVTAIADEKSATGGDVWAWVSQDQGKLWNKSVKPLNSVHGSAREGLHGLAANRKGMIACVWLDLRNARDQKPGTEVWMSLSKDNGITWQPDRVVYSNPGGTVCECCHPSVAIDDAGVIHVMFRNAKDGNRDMYLTSTTDDGKTWSDVLKLGKASWKLNACPMDGGDLILKADSSPECVWMRKNEVFVSQSKEPERRLGEGRQPIAASTDQMVWFGWVDKRKLVSQWGDNPAMNIAEDAAFPTAVSLKANRVAVAYETKQEIHILLLSAP